MADTTRYRCGAVSFSLEEIRQTGYRHGEDGIGFYPPSQWGDRGIVGKDVFEAYHEGYQAGKAAWEEQFGPRK